LKVRIVTNSPNSRFVYVIFIPKSAEKLRLALTDPDFTKQYWFGMHQQTDWKVGAPRQLLFADGRVADIGEIAEVVPNARLVLCWRNEFTAEFKSEGNARCTIEREPIEDVVWSVRIRNSFRPFPAGGRVFSRTLNRGWRRGSRS
jgi:uncharacterized protein YndB with AHSA1/START domain